MNDGDWVRLDSREQALRWLDQQLNEARHVMSFEVLAEGFSPALTEVAMQRLDAVLDRAHQRGLAEIDAAFSSSATRH
jgi:hypothetical protein